MPGNSVMRRHGRGEVRAVLRVNRPAGGTTANRMAIASNPYLSFMPRTTNHGRVPLHPGSMANCVRFEDVDLFHLSKEPEK